MKRQRRLELALEERIHALRREYEQPSQDPQPTLVHALDYVGIQLVGELELLQLLRSHALSEARGSSNAIMDDTQRYAQPIAQWIRSAGEEEPNLLVRQISKRIDFVKPAELPASHLLHWSQTQLLLPFKPRTDFAGGELVCFHPKKRSDFGEVQFVNDLSSMLECCHLGQYALSNENYCFEVSSKNWMHTVRNLKKSVLRFAKKSEGKEGRDVLLLVWPDEAWDYVRSALSCFSPVMFISTRRTVEVQIVRESRLLSNARRKQSLLNLSFALFANRGLGAFCLKSTEERQQHVALIRGTGQQRWITFAWCLSDGLDLGVDCLSDFTADGGEALIEVLRKRINHTGPIVLLAFGFPPNHFRAVDGVIEANSNSTSTIPREIRKELDDLSYLTEVSNLPSVGASEGFVLGTFSSSNSQVLGNLPLHLQCAWRLFVMLQGVVPATPVDRELEFNGLRKLTAMFLFEDELKLVLVTEKMQVQEARVEDWITKLPRHHFDNLCTRDDVRAKFQTLWEVYFG